MSAGVLIKENLSISFGYTVFFMMAACLFLFIYFISGKNTAALFMGIGILAVCAGIGRAAVTDAALENKSLGLVGSSGVFTGIVKEYPKISDSVTDIWRYKVELSKLKYEDGAQRNISGAVYLYIPENSSFAPGDELHINGKLSPLRIYKNPGEMNMEGRYRSEGLIGRIYVKKPQEAELNVHKKAYMAERKSGELKKELKNRFDRWINKDNASLLMTLLFGGDYEKIPKEVTESFSDTGIIHILSVSGSHISLLFGFIYLLGSWFHLPDKVTWGLAIILVGIYAAMAGFVPPVIRASLMGILSVGGLFLKREKDALNLLGAAVILMLLINPLYLYDVSFQLSLGASAGILLAYPSLRKLLHRISFIPEWIREGTALSVSAQVFTVPFIIYDFHSFPVYFILSNLLVTPLLEWVIILGLLASLLIFVIPLAAGCVLSLISACITVALAVNFHISDLPSSSYPVRGMTLCEILFYYGIILFFFIRNKLDPVPYLKKGIISALSFLGCVVIYGFLTSPSMMVSVPDLGMAKGCVITSGDKTAVYYCEGNKSSYTSAREFNSIIGYRGIRKVDLAVLDFTELREPSCFSFSVPAEKILVIGLKKKSMAGEGLKNEVFEVFDKKKHRNIALGDMSLSTDGENCAFINRYGMLYIDRAPRIMKGLHVSSGHVAWTGGNRRFKSVLSNDKIRMLTPEAAAYMGDRTQQTGEDMDFLSFYGCPSGNTEKDGLIELRLDGHWKLRRYTDWFGRL